MFETIVLKKNDNGKYQFFGWITMNLLDKEYDTQGQALLELDKDQLKNITII